MCSVCAHVHIPPTNLGSLRLHSLALITALARQVKGMCSGPSGPSVWSYGGSLRFSSGLAFGRKSPMGAGTVHILLLPYTCCCTVFGQSELFRFVR